MKIACLYALLGSVAALTMKVRTKGTVRGILNLLEEMQESIATETEDAEKANAKFECWCNKIDALQEEIDGADAKLKNAVAQIEEFTAKADQAKTQIKELEASLEENGRNQDQLVAMRQKEEAEFNAAEKDYNDSISAVGSAIKILAKHQPLADVKAALRSAPVTNAKITAFLQDSGSTTDDYESQSGVAFGMLTQMKTQFETDLAESRAEEATAKAAYSEIMEAKQEEAKTLHESLATNKDTLAHADETVVEARRDQKGAAELRLANTESMNQGKVACKDEADKYALEKKDRAEEAQAVGEAIQLLSSDETFAANAAANPRKTKESPPPSLSSFVQSRTRVINKRRLAAIKTLRAAGTPKAFLLSNKVGNEAFDTIIKAGHQMIDNIRENMKSDTEAKDSCDHSLNDGDTHIQGLKEDIADLELAKDGYEQNDIPLAQGNIDAFTDDINGLTTDLNDEAKVRTEENARLHQTIAEQTKFQEEIRKARRALEKFYTKKGHAESFVQQGPVVEIDAEMPVTKTYEKQDSNVVLQLFDDVVERADATIKQAQDDEVTEQADYEEWVRMTNEDIEAFKDNIAYAQANLAAASTGLMEVQADLDGKNAEHEDFSRTHAERQESCKFIQENFDIRQEKMNVEIGAINDALSKLQAQAPAAVEQATAAAPAAVEEEATAAAASATATAS